MANPTKDPRKFRSKEAAGDYLVANGYEMVAKGHPFPWRKPGVNIAACRAVDHRGFHLVYYKAVNPPKVAS